jgi:CheY-like chemotaxis protein
MNKNVTILITEDDEGHAALIERNLRRSGIVNEILQFRDGEQVMDFLWRKGENGGRKPGGPYLLLLDIRMPKLDGLDVLKRIKDHEELKKMPVIIITTTDDPYEIDLCHRFGCNSYITKPVEYDRFVEAIRSLGSFLSIIKIPDINGKMIQLNSY